MKEITKFQASDGTEFSVLLDGMQYETNCKKVKEVFAPLNSKIEGVDKEISEMADFRNGGAYIRHELETVILVRNRFWKCVQELYPFINEFNPNIWERVLSDATSPIGKFLYRQSYRINCIDSQGREWGQPYYAINGNVNAMELT